MMVGLLLALLITCAPAKAADVTLAWDANSDSTLAGYKVYSGSSSRSYSGTVDVGNWTNCVMSGLEAGKTYYFAAKAYDKTGIESDYSNEVAYTVPSVCSFSVSPVSQSYAASGGAGTVAVTAGSTCSWSAVASDTWLTVTAGPSGTGPGTVSYLVAANTGSASRTATLSAGGQTVTVSQSGYTAAAYSITASTGSGGSISPAGTATVSSGASKAYTITPASGYSVSYVQVDGLNVGAVSAYTFSNVKANHSIRAVFRKSSWWSRR
jgi:hypothetical protein